MERVSDGVKVPDGEVLPIKSMSAYVAVDDTDLIEGVVAFFNNGAWMPMVAADQEMIASLRPIAEATAREMGCKISLIRFSNREVLVDDILAKEQVDGG